MDTEFLCLVVIIIIFGHVDGIYRARSMTAQSTGDCKMVYMCPTFCLKNRGKCFVCECGESLKMFIKSAASQMKSDYHGVYQTGSQFSNKQMNSGSQQTAMSGNPIGPFSINVMMDGSKWVHTGRASDGSSQWLGGASNLKGHQWSLGQGAVVNEGKFAPMMTSYLEPNFQEFYRPMLGVMPGQCPQLDQACPVECWKINGFTGCMYCACPSTTTTMKPSTKSTHHYTYKTKSTHRPRPINKTDKTPTAPDASAHSKTITTSVATKRKESYSLTIRTLPLLMTSPSSLVSSRRTSPPQTSTETQTFSTATTPPPVIISSFPNQNSLIGKTSGTITVTSPSVPVTSAVTSPQTPVTSAVTSPPTPITSPSTSVTKAMTSSTLIPKGMTSFSSVLTTDMTPSTTLSSSLLLTAKPTTAQHSKIQVPFTAKLGGILKTSNVQPFQAGHDTIKNNNAYLQELLKVLGNTKMPTDPKTSTFRTKQPTPKSHQVPTHEAVTTEKTSLLTDYNIETLESGGAAGKLQLHSEEIPHSINSIVSTPKSMQGLTGDNQQYNTLLQFFRDIDSGENEKALALIETFLTKFNESKQTGNVLNETYVLTKNSAEQSIGSVTHQQGTQPSVSAEEHNNDKKESLLMTGVGRINESIVVCRPIQDECPDECLFLDGDNYFCPVCRCEKSQNVRNGKSPGIATTEDICLPLDKNCPAGCEGFNAETFCPHCTCKT